MSGRFLLDTHCWLWWNAEPERLNPHVRAIIGNVANAVFLSAASAWEIAIKHGLGRISLPEPPARYVPSRIAANRITGLPIQFQHVLKVGDLPSHHRDPFDRLLIAQAITERMTLVSADPKILLYDLEVLDAA